MQELLGYDPKYEGFDPKYPPPPRVHWMVLLAVWLVISSCIHYYAPSKYVGLLSSLVADAWAFYLCNWIRTLDPDAKSPFWCDIYVVVELTFVGLRVMQNPSGARVAADALLAIASAVLGILTVFMIRRDLVRHYNEREHAGLVLDGSMTFFFSFIYFQYHLYDIAQRKKRADEGVLHRAYRA